MEGQPGITTDTAIALGKALGSSDQYWLNLQSAYQLSQMKERRVV